MDWSQKRFLVSSAFLDVCTVARQWFALASGNGVGEHPLFSCSRWSHDMKPWKGSEVKRRLRIEIYILNEMYIWTCLTFMILHKYGAWMRIKDIKSHIRIICLLFAAVCLWSYSVWCIFFTFLIYIPDYTFLLAPIYLSNSLPCNLPISISIPTHFQNLCILDPS